MSCVKLAFDMGDLNNPQCLIYFHFNMHARPFNILHFLISLKRNMYKQFILQLLWFLKIPKDAIIVSQWIYKRPGLRQSKALRKYIYIYFFFVYY